MKMDKFLLTLATWLTAFTAMADRVVVFNSADIWPVAVCMETSFGPMPTGYYIISMDDVEIEFQMNDDMENVHDAYYLQGKMDIYSQQYGIKQVACSYRPADDASLSPLPQINYQYTVSTTMGDGVGEMDTLVFDFFDKYWNYVGLVGKADIATIAVTIDDNNDSTDTRNAISMADSPTVARVRYFNANGQEIQQPAGLTIRLIIYTDGSTSVDKLFL